jgi:hypothetical protein
LPVPGSGDFTLHLPIPGVRLTEGAEVAFSILAAGASGAITINGGFLRIHRIA